MVTAPKPVDFLDATCTNSNRGFKSNKVQPRESLDSGECNIRHTIRKYLARKVNDRTIQRQTLALVYGYYIGQNERKESTVDVYFS